MTFAFVKTALRQGVIGASLYDFPTTNARRLVGARARARLTIGGQARWPRLTCPMQWLAST